MVTPSKVTSESHKKRVAFGGDNYETLYVTSQQSFLTDEELARHPKPGSLFAIHDLGVQGLPDPKLGA